MKIYLAGEGRHELGRWEESIERRSTSTRSDGVLTELFRHVHHDVDVVGGVTWKSIRKFRSGGHADAETRNLRGAELHADEAGADALVWARDTDGDPERVRSLVAAMKTLGALSVQAAGHYAEPCIESWALALAEKHHSPDTVSKARVEELALEHGADTEDAMVELARKFDSSKMTTVSSISLRAWFASARRVSEPTNRA